MTPLPSASRHRRVNPLSISLALVAAMAGIIVLGDASTARASVDRIYTLPFYSSVAFECHFTDCYAGHNGTDYQLGNPSTGGENVVAAYGGTVYSVDSQTSAGKYIVIDHGNTHMTRYLHLQSFVVSSGSVARGQRIGYEGHTGGPWCQNPPTCSIYASPDHLHFETKINATSGNYSSGTPVNPYSSSTFLWTLDPPVYAASACYFPVDSASGPGRYPGVFRPEQNNSTKWYLKYANSSGNHDLAFGFGVTCDVPVVGDWNGDGVDTVGVWRAGVWYLNSVNGGGSPTGFGFGDATDFPVVGDWDGDGDDTVGIFRWTGGAPEFHLNNQNDNSGAEYQFAFGNHLDRPVVGDWDGTGGTYGTVTVGVFRPSTAQFHLKNYNSSGGSSFTFSYGSPTDTPITGDWNWDGIDTIGIFRPIVGAAPAWKLNNANDSSGPDYDFSYGALSDKPVTGDWN